MINNLWISLLLLVPTSSSNLNYQCDVNKHALSTPVDRFDDNQDGTLTDIETGLTWMRCVLGQNWNGVACLGNAKAYNWLAANEQVKLNNNNGGFANYRDWRLPRLPELAGIIERQCNNPRINLALFPNTPASPFWSANVKNGADNIIYALSFGVEGIMLLDKESTNMVRLVRGRNLAN